MPRSSLRFSSPSRQQRPLRQSSRACRPAPVGPRRYPGRMDRMMRPHAIRAIMAPPGRVCATNSRHAGRTHIRGTGGGHPAARAPGRIGPPLRSRCSISLPSLTASTTEQDPNPPSNISSQAKWSLNRPLFQGKINFTAASEATAKANVAAGKNK
jgi:hypothetical protein